MPEKTIAELEAELVLLKEARNRKPIADASTVLSNSVPSGMVAETPAAENRYAATTWGENEFDFRVPSGQLCRLRKVPVEKLAEEGILDRVTRLPGIAGELVDASDGQPPKVAATDEMPDGETIRAVLEVLDILIPMVVVAPEIWSLPSEGEERVVGRIYVDSIEVTDRVAIMHRVLGGLKKLDSFRPQS